MKKQKKIKGPMTTRMTDVLASPGWSVSLGEARRAFAH